MTKSLSREIAEKREQVKALQDEIENLSDYLDVLEARAKDLSTPRLTHDEVKKRYRVKSPKQAARRNGRKIAA
jgi:hypothetical protein